jgi:hypothetical protein
VGGSHLEQDAQPAVPATPATAPESLMAEAASALSAAFSDKNLFSAFKRKRKPTAVAPTAVPVEVSNPPGPTASPCS